MNKEPINSLLFTTLYNTLFKNEVAPKIGTTVSFSNTADLIYYGSCTTEAMAQVQIEILLGRPTVICAYMLIVNKFEFSNYYIIFLQNKS